MHEAQRPGLGETRRARRSKGTFLGLLVGLSIGAVIAIVAAPFIDSPGSIALVTSALVLSGVLLGQRVGRGIYGRRVSAQRRR